MINEVDERERVGVAWSVMVLLWHHRGKSWRGLNCNRALGIPGNGTVAAEECPCMFPVLPGPHADSAGHSE